MTLDLFRSYSITKVKEGKINVHVKVFYLNALDMPFESFEKSTNTNIQKLKIEIKRLSLTQDQNSEHK